MALRNTLEDSNVPQMTNGQVFLGFLLPVLNYASFERSLIPDPSFTFINHFA